MTTTLMNLVDYTKLDCLEIVEGIRNRSLSPVDLVDAALALIEQLNPKLNCYAFTGAEAAREHAGLLEVEARAGQFRGPLHGLPISVKDNVNVPGLPTARGSKAPAKVATEWSLIAQRLYQSGAILLGKTAMPEMGWTVAGKSQLTGPTRNPWNTDLTSGGSSSGSAAAVAARIVPAAIGTDAGGSIRVPASFCGLFGLKPSFGRVPVWPGSVNDRVLHHGFLTRTVLDTALLLDVAKGPDKRDPYSLPVDRRQYLQLATKEPTGIRVGFVPSPWGVAVEDDVGIAIGRCVAVVSKDWPIIEMQLDGSPGRDAYEILWSAARLGVATASCQDVDPGFSTATQRARRYASLADYLRANSERRALSERIEGLFDDVDVIIMPTMPITPFGATASDPGPENPDRVLPWLEWAPLAFPFNLTGHPAASLPCGFTAAGLPVGLQVIGPRFSDGLILSLCHAIEKRLDLNIGIPAITQSKL